MVRLLSLGGILPPLARIELLLVLFDLLMGSALAEDPKEHPWLMSLAPTNGAMKCQCARKIQTSGGKNVNLWWEKKYGVQMMKRKCL